MKRKFFPIILSAVLLALGCGISASCSGNDEFSFKVASGVTASLSDNGRYGFVLTVKGEGEIPDYASAKDAPWYRKSGRITDVVIGEGITKIGDNAFTDCKVKTVVVPSTAKTVGRNCFYKNTGICVFGETVTADGAKTYAYSETKPDTENTHWRYIGNTASVWEKKKVLFIGNSFTYYSDIPALFNEIAVSAGEWTEVESVTRGSWTLKKFADKNDEYGKIVDEKLTSNNDYDAIILQEQSTKPLNDYDGFLSSVKSLQSKINRTQADCRIYLYSTWGYKEEADARKITVPEMEAKIREAYEKAASAAGLKVCYVGSAFTAVYNDYPDLNLYYQDNKHPSYTGAFLSACVHFATVLDIDPRISPYIGGLDADTANILKTAAYNAVH